MKKTFFAIALLATPAYAEEIQLVRFICSSPHTVSAVVWNEENIFGITPLPNGCEWVIPFEYGTIGDTVQTINAPEDQYARISHVTINGKKGFSAGIVHLIN